MLPNPKAWAFCFQNPSHPGSELFGSGIALSACISGYHIGGGGKGAGTDGSGPDVLKWPNNTFYCLVTRMGTMSSVGNRAEDVSVDQE